MSSTGGLESLKRLCPKHEYLSARIFHPFKPSSCHTHVGCTRTKNEVEREVKERSGDIAPQGENNMGALDLHVMCMDITSSASALEVYT